METSASRVAEAVNYARVVFGGETGNEKVFAFTPIPIEDEYGVGVSILGVAGYVSNMIPDRFADYTSANSFCEAANEAMGYRGDTAQAIIIDGMTRSEFKREQKSDIVKIKLHAAQIDDAIEALEFHDNDITDVLEVLKEAREELAERFESTPSYR